MRNLPTLGLHPALEIGALSTGVAALLLAAMSVGGRVVTGLRRGPLAAMLEVDSDAAE
jgi:hypothetical protein